MSLTDLNENKTFLKNINFPWNDFWYGGIFYHKSCLIDIHIHFFQMLWICLLLKRPEV